MRPRAPLAPCPVFLVFLLVTLVSSSSASVLGLRPLPADPPLRYLGEDVEVLLDRAAELEPLRVDLSSEEGTLRRAQLQRQEFLEEVTGISEGGKVIKGTRIDLSQLTPGPWLLRVIVDNRNARSDAFRKLEIQIQE